MCKTFKSIYRLIFEFCRHKHTEAEFLYYTFYRFYSRIAMYCKYLHFLTSQIFYHSSVGWLCKFLVHTNKYLQRYGLFIFTPNVSFYYCVTKVINFMRCQDQSLRLKLRSLRPSHDDLAVVAGECSADTQQIRVRIPRPRQWTFLHICKFFFWG